MKNKIKKSDFKFESYFERHNECGKRWNTHYLSASIFGFSLSPIIEIPFGKYEGENETEKTKAQAKKEFKDKFDSIHIFHKKPYREIIFDFLEKKLDIKISNKESFYL